MLNFTRWQTIGLWLAMSVLVASSLTFQQPAFAIDAPGEQQILFEVARQDLITDRINTTVDAIRTRLRVAKIGYRDLAGSRSVQVRIRDAADVDRAKAALADLLVPTVPPDEPASMAEWAITVLADWFSPTPPAVSIIELSMEEPEPGLLKFSVTDAGIDFRLDLAVKGSIAVISHRIDELDLGEPVIERQGADRFLVKVSDIRDPDTVIDLLTVPANMTFQLVDQSMSAQEALAGLPPAGSKILYSNNDPPTPYLIEDRVLLSGENLVDAQATLDQRTGEPVVAFHLDKEGTIRFAEVTENNVGRLFAVLFDEIVITAPMIREPIRGGSGQISGNFTEQSANYLAVLLRSGALPAALHVLETHFVPSEP